MMRAILNAILILIFVSCVTESTKPVNETKEEMVFQPKYAKGFRVTYYDETIQIDLFHPTQKELLQSIYLSDTSKIKLYPERVFALSVTHLAFLKTLGLADKVKGFGHYDYIFDTATFQKDKLVDFAISDRVDVEKVIINQPDILFVSGLLEQSPEIFKLKQSNIPIVDVVEWAEVHPLARAEWLKFFAVFYGLETKADSIFGDIERHYLSVKKMTDSIANNQKPTVLTGSNYKGTWYMPGAQNFSSILMGDAGGNYPVATQNSTSESIPYNFETVVKNFADVDIWLRPGASSLEGLLSEDVRYAKFTPFKKQQVFDVKKRLLDNGANDYWETALVRPDILLKDLTKIFHPNLLPNHELHFYERLE